MSTTITPDTDKYPIEGPFSRAEALAAGVPPSALRGGHVQTVFRGMYVWAHETITPLVRTRAALALHEPSAFASHHSAARLHGLPDLLRAGDEHVSVFDRRQRRRRHGIRSHLAMPDASVVLRRGLRVSHVLDTFVELAPIVSLVDLAVVGDAIASRGLARLDQLIGVADALQRPGRVAARRAARLCRAGVDSPMETRLRLLLDFAGLPEPEVNHTIRDQQGEVLRRFDLCYPSVTVLVEYDGRQHAETSAQWLRDITRREELDQQGWRLIVVTAEGVYQSPATTLQRVHDALRERRYTPLPAALSSEWRFHFPPR